jgi:HEAT repeat protein
MRPFTRFFFASVLLSSRVLGQVEVSVKGAETAPTNWQVAGIRAAFGDSRVPLPDQSSAVQREALKICADHGWGSAIDPREAAVYLGSQDRSLQRAALEALGQMGRPAGRFSKEIVDFILSDDADHASLRKAAVLAAAKIAAAGAPIDQEASALLHSPNPAVRIGGLEVLGAAGDKSPAHVSEIAGYLRDSRTDVQVAALEALREIGPPAAGAARQIVGLLEGMGSTIDRAATKALATIDPDGISYGGLFEFSSSDERSAWPASSLPSTGLWISGSMRTTIPDLPILDGSLANDLRVEAIRQTKDLDAKGILRIKKALSCDIESVRTAAADALCELGNRSVEQGDEAAALLDDPDARVRAAAMEAIARMDETGSRYLTRIAALLDDPDAHIRRSAVWALCNFGPAAAVCAPKLAA